MSIMRAPEQSATDWINLLANVSPTEGRDPKLGIRVSVTSSPVGISKITVTAEPGEEVETFFKNLITFQKEIAMSVVGVFSGIYIPCNGDRSADFLFGLWTGLTTDEDFRLLK